MGERWSFMILRASFNGLHHFEEFLSELGIARNILSNRLAKLVENGILKRDPCAEDKRKIEYRLTDKGLDLLPAMVALRQWGQKYGAEVVENPVLVDERDRLPIGPTSILSHDGRILVGRQHSWPQGRYSALAGFVEPGETIEEAVIREIREEAGVTVHSVRYVMSQPWPFPSSLMIACIGQAEDTALTLDETEIEHAFWVDAAGVAAAMAGDPDAPFIAAPPMAVAWHLLKHWLDGQVAPTGPSA